MQFAFSSVISKLVYGLLLSGAYKFLEFIMCKTSDAQVSAGSGDSSVEYQKWMHLIPKLLEFKSGGVVTRRIAFGCLYCDLPVHSPVKTNGRVGEFTSIAFIFSHR